LADFDEQLAQTMPVQAKKKPTPIKSKDRSLLPLMYKSAISSMFTKNNKTSPTSTSPAIKVEIAEATNALGTSLNYQHEFKVIPIEPVAFTFDDSSSIHVR
jgi:hypothetical protein